MNGAGRKITGIFQRTLIGHQMNNGAMVLQRNAQRLRRKQMSAGAART